MGENANIGYLLRLYASHVKTEMAAAPFSTTSVHAHQQLVP